MTTASPPASLTLQSVDEFLGAREGRFFGEGFKRVVHTLTDITVRPSTEGGTIGATAGIAIPGSWSRKGEVSQRPHLSTLDVMHFGASLTGLYLAHAHGAGPHDPFTVRALTIKAGRQPQEDHLDTFEVSGRHLSTTSLGSGVHRTTMACRVGLLSIEVDAEHGSAPPHRPVPDGHHTAANALPGPWNRAPFGTPHRHRSQLLTSVEADVARLRAAAELTLVDDPAGAVTESGDGGAAGQPSMIDHFVSALQLGQVLLYALDEVDRAASNTLWMRRTVLEPSDAADDGRLGVTLEKVRGLPSKQGTWRSADIVSTFGGRRLRCSVAHLLPKSTC